MTAAIPVNGSAEAGQTDDRTRTSEELARGREASPTRNAVETFVLLLTLCSALFLAALDFTIVSTALPTISEYFHSTTGYTWVGSAFMLAAAVVAPSWGKFSDVWGRKPILLAANSIFFLGSAVCGAATSIGMLVAGRAIQGAAGGGIFALINIIVGDLFSQRDRGKYYGYVGLVWTVAFVLGPLIGGAFTKEVSWRWCFYLNLPISFTCFFIILFRLKLDTPKTAFWAGIKVIDWLGSLILIGGLLLLLFGLVLGGVDFPWDSVTVICLIVFGVITLVIFFLLERYVARYPVVPVHLYANISNIAIAVVNLFHGIVATGNTYFLPLYCQAVLGVSPFLSGVLLLPFAVLLSLGTVAAGIYIKKTGRYHDTFRIGLLLATLGSGLYYDLPDRKYWPKIILYQTIAGLGVGLVFPGPMIALQNSVPEQDNGAATASFGLVRNVAFAIGVVIGSALFSNGMTREHNRITAALGADLAELFSSNNAQANVLQINNLTSTQQVVVRHAYWTSLRSIWIASACFAATAFLACFFISNNKLKEEHVIVKTGLDGEEERRRITIRLTHISKAHSERPEAQLV